MVRRVDFESQWQPFWRFNEFESFANERPVSRAKDWTKLRINNQKLVCDQARQSLYQRTITIGNSNVKFCIEAR